MFKNRLGQTLIELLAAVVIIQIGLFSVWSLFLVNYNATQESKMRIVAINLAREGVEIVKNKRDSNWLKRASNIKTVDNYFWTWDNGLSNGGYIVDYHNQNLVPLASGTSPRLYIKDGFYSSDTTGSSTLYSRKLTINSICCTDAEPDFKCDNSVYTTSSLACSLRIGINVISEVSWEIGTKMRKTVVEENLYDWQ